MYLYSKQINVIECTKYLQKIENFLEWRKRPEYVTAKLDFVMWHIAEQNESLVLPKKKEIIFESHFQHKCPVCVNKKF